MLDQRLDEESTKIMFAQKAQLDEESTKNIFAQKAQLDEESTKKMFAQRAQIMVLIDEYKHRELLWNTKHKDYHNKMKRDIAWIDLANAFNVTDFEVKKKVENLKGTYRSLKSRVKNNKGQLRWFAFEKMQFLDYCKGDPVVNADSAAPVAYVNCDGAYMNSGMDEMVTVCKKEPECRLTEDENLVTDETLQSEDMSEELEKECVHFGNFIAMKLSKLNDHQRSVAQYQIHEILFKLENTGN